MTKEDLFFLEDLFKRVKNPDARIQRAKAIIDREVAIYNAKVDRLIRDRTYNSDFSSM